jgi:hypothetical protein
MKNAKLTGIVAIMTAAISLAAAQETDVIIERTSPPTPPPPGDVADVERAVADATRQIDSQKMQLEKAARAMADARKDMTLAQARSEEQNAFVHKIAGGRSGGRSRALVIPKDSTDAKNIAEVEEDLNVMAHILDKASSENKGARAMGIAVFGWSPGAAPQNLYIEGHGAIFFLNVNYPLLPPATKKDDSDAKEKPDTEWDEARREIAGVGRGQGPDVFLFENHLMDPWAGKAGMEYDAERVEDLKKDLVSALKNAANIRKLRGDETVTVVVTGAAAGTAGKTIKTSSGGGGGGRESGSRTVNEYRTVSKFGTSGGANPVSASKLILRARKSDTEAFQNGKLNGDEFRKKVTVMLY